MREEKIPQGYKQTEIGTIPEDWEISELQNAVDFLDGLRRPVKSGDRAKISGIYPYYGASGIVDYVNDFIFDVVGCFGGVYVFLFMKKIMVN